MTRPSSGRTARWRRFRLRTLLIAIACLSLALAYLTHRIHEGTRQRQVARQLADLGCFVEFSHYELVPGPSHPNPMVQVRRRQSTLPTWVEAAGLADAFRRIERVSLDRCPPENLDEAIELAGQLDHLPIVSSFRTKLTEQQVKSLLSSVPTTALYLESSELPRGRLPCLDQARLEWLSVARTQFSDPAIADLPATLEYFDATRTRISDDGLSGFGRLKRLKKLILRRTPTTAEAVERLRSEMPWCEIDWEPLNGR